MGFTAPSLPHCLKNPFEVDLVYLMGGKRRSDACGGLCLRKLVDWEHLKSF